MQTPSGSEPDDGMLPEYDFSEAEVGKYAARYALTREGGVVAKPRRFGSAYGQLTVPDDFDAPLEDLRDYV